MSNDDTNNGNNNDQSFPNDLTTQLLNAINNPNFNMPSSLLSSQLSSLQGLNQGINNVGGSFQGLNQGVNNLATNFFIPPVIPASNQFMQPGDDLDALLPRPFPLPGNVQQQQQQLLSLQSAAAPSNGMNPQINGLQFANLNSLQLSQMGGFQDANLQNVMNGMMGQHNSLNGMMGQQNSLNGMMGQQLSLNGMMGQQNSLNGMNGLNFNSIAGLPVSLTNQLTEMLNNNPSSMTSTTQPGGTIGTNALPQMAQQPQRPSAVNQLVNNAALTQQGNKLTSNEMQSKQVASPPNMAVGHVRREIPSSTTKAGKPLKAREARWNIRYKELVIFQREHGHCRVPHGYAPNRKLAWWVMNQRAQFCHLHTGKKTWLTPERIKMLDDIGFVWNPHVKKQSSSSTMKKTGKKSTTSQDELSDDGDESHDELSVKEEVDL